MTCPSFQIVQRCRPIRKVRHIAPVPLGAQFVLARLEDRLLLLAGRAQGQLPAPVGAPTNTPEWLAAPQTPPASDATTTAPWPSTPIRRLRSSMSGPLSVMLLCKPHLPSAAPGTQAFTKSVSRTARRRTGTRQERSRVLVARARCRLGTVRRPPLAVIAPHWTQLLALTITSTSPALVAVARGARRRRRGTSTPRSRRSRAGRAAGRGCGWGRRRGSRCR